MPNANNSLRKSRTLSMTNGKKVTKQIGEPGITAKHFQNPELLCTLVSTKKKTIVEASKDSLWGTGVPLHSNDTLTCSKWKNKGIMNCL